MEDASQTPNVLQYSAIKPMANPPSALSHVRLIPSTGESYQPGQNIRIPIGLPQDSLADMNRAFITYKITNKSTLPAGGTSGDNTAYLDPQIGGVSVIDIFRVVSGTGSLLDETIQYGNYVGCLYTHDGIQHANTTRNIMARSSGTAQTADSIGTSTTASPNEGVANPDANGAARESILTNGSAYITHYPCSSVFKADKLLPFSFAQGISYVDITLAQATAAFCFKTSYTGTPDWTISDVKLHVPILQLPSDFASSFRQLLASGIPVQVHSVAAQNTQQALASGGGSIVSTFASRKRSVKALLLNARKSSDLTSQKADSMTCRRCLGVTNFDFTIGGVRMPSTQIELAAASKKFGEALAHTNQALGHTSTLNGICATDDNYYQATDNGNNGSKIVYGLDLESYKDTISGYNLSGNGLPIVWNALGGAGTANANVDSSCILSLYVIHDVMFSIDGISGTMSASS